MDLPLWRAVVVFRFAALAYAAALLVASDLEHEARGWVVIAVMAVWTVVTAAAYTSRSRRRWPLLVADLVIAAACLYASRYVIPAAELVGGHATIPMAWVAGPVVAWGVAGGRRWGAAAALLLGGVDLAIRGGPTDVTVNGTVLLLLAGVVMGHVSRLTDEAEGRLQQAIELEAVTRERERLARGIHDSVLQVLALVQRRGTELGGEAAELGRLAGEQEATLRALVAGTSTDAPGQPAQPSAAPGRAAAGMTAMPGTAGVVAAGRDGGVVAAGRGAGVVATARGGGVVAAGRGAGVVAAGRPGGAVAGPGRAGEADLRTLLGPFASATVSVSTPATAVTLPRAVAAEVAAAVGSALVNVKVHCGPMARAWILVEDEREAVTVTVRDDGPGIAAGRLAEAAAAGRLGVAQSIQGRMRDLGGDAAISSAAGQGTEVELSVPRPGRRPRGGAWS